MEHTGKKVLIVTQHFWPESFRINDIVEGFLESGIAVDVLCGLPNYPKGEWFSGYSKNGPLRETYHGAQIYRCREFPRKGNTGKTIFLNYISWPWHAWHAVARLPGGYDAVLCYNTSPVLMGWPAIRASRRFRAPLTNYVLDIWPENLYSVLPVKNKLLRGIARGVSDWLYRRADRLIAMSPGLETRLRARVGEKNARRCVESQKQYAVIPQYCEDFYAKPAADATLKTRFAGRFVWMFAGNFSPAQSLETALDAMAAFAKKAAAAPADTALNAVDPATQQAVPRALLLLVGDGMSRTALKEKAQALGLENSVCFYGSVKPADIPAIAGACDALLVSLSDSPDLGLTIPAKLASCMAMQKPLLASLNGEGAAAAAESGGALISPACDAAALCENLEQLCRMDETGRAAMGRAAYAYYDAHYRRSVLLQRLESFIF